MRRVRYCVTFTDRSQRVIDGYETEVRDGVLYIYTDADLRSKTAFVLANVKTWSGS